MFLVGLEFDTELIRSRLRSAVGVSVSGILTPFVLGCGLGFFLIQGGGFFSPDVVVWEGMFFIGAAMSITAFPMPRPDHLRAWNVRHLAGRAGLGRWFESTTPQPGVLALVLAQLHR
jgi:hypothetical protein